MRRVDVGKRGVLLVKPLLKRLLGKTVLMAEIISARTGSLAAELWFRGSCGVQRGVLYSCNIAVKGCPIMQTLLLAAGCDSWVRKRPSLITGPMCFLGRMAETEKIMPGTEAEILCRVGSMEMRECEAITSCRVNKIRPFAPRQVAEAAGLVWQLASKRCARSNTGPMFASWQ